MKASFQDNNNAVEAFAHQEVEQEREVAIEVETVREVQKPQHSTPLAHRPVHRDIFSFAEHGRLAAGSQAYTPMYEGLRRTAVGLSTGLISKQVARCSYPPIFPVQ